MDILKTLAAGIVAIGLVTAIGMHSTQLATLTQTGGQATSGLFNTAEKG